jgi:hypothetical protein
MNRRLKREGRIGVDYLWVPPDENPLRKNYSSCPSRCRSVEVYFCSAFLARLFNLNSSLLVTCGGQYHKCILLVKSV